MIKRFLRSEKGETNIVSLIVLLAVMVGAALLFKPYLTELCGKIAALISG